MKVITRVTTNRMSNLMSCPLSTFYIRLRKLRTNFWKKYPLTTTDSDVEELDHTIVTEQFSSTVPGWVTATCIYVHCAPSAASGIVKVSFSTNCRWCHHWNVSTCLSFNEATVRHICNWDGEGRWHNRKEFWITLGCIIVNCPCSSETHLFVAITSNPGFWTKECTTTLEWKQVCWGFPKIG